MHLCEGDTDSQVATVRFVSHFALLQEQCLGEVCGEDGGGSVVRPSYSAYLFSHFPCCEGKRVWKGPECHLETLVSPWAAAPWSFVPSPCSGDAIPTIVVNTYAFP